MGNVFKIAWCNLSRYKRRTLLTGSLIAIGVILVIVFSGVGSSFTNHIIGLLVNTSVGNLQIHKKGYMSSLDNLPLDLSITEKGVQKIEKLLKANEQIEAFSERIRFGAMISNFQSTTNLRLMAVIPEMEIQTCPDLLKRIKQSLSDPSQFVKPGEIIVPENIAKGFGLEVGNDVVLIASNKDGSVNGLNLRVSGIAESIMGPTGKDGYLHLDDARTLLRIETNEITEVAIKLKRFDQTKQVYQQLLIELGTVKPELGMGQMGQHQSQKNSGKPMLEVHTWEKLVPFMSIVQIVDLLIVMVRVFLISIVLMSIMNLMLMSVFERISEIGTIASIGTLPGRILALFLAEGFSLGLVSSIVGSLIGMGILQVLNTSGLSFMWGRTAISLTPEIPFEEVLLTIGIVIAISVLSSLQPAIKASRLEPVEALRHV
jgi:putative ABC transport system permease protein